MDTALVSNTAYVSELYNIFYKEYNVSKNIYIIFYYDISAFILYIFSQYNTNIIQLTNRML